MAAGRKNNEGNPVDPRANYDQTFKTTPTMGSSRVGARASQPTTGSPEKPPSRGQGANSGGRKPHHYGERAHTTITQGSWPGKGSSARAAGKPHH